MTTADQINYVAARIVTFLNDADRGGYRDSLTAESMTTAVEIFKAEASKLSSDQLSNI